MTQWNVPLHHQFILEFISLLCFPCCTRTSFLTYFCCILPCCSISVVLISSCYFWLYLTCAGSNFYCHRLGLVHQEWLLCTSNSCRNAHEIPSRRHDQQMPTGGQNLNSGAGCWGWKLLGRAASMSLGFSCHSCGGLQMPRNQIISFGFWEWGKWKGTVAGQKRVCPSYCLVVWRLQCWLWVITFSSPLKRLLGGMVTARSL